MRQIDPMTNQPRSSSATVSRRHFIGVTGGLAFGGHVQAAAWPTRAIRFVAPVPPGGAVDLFVRALAEQLAGPLTQTLFVEAKPGAGGLLGARAVARAAPDGYTMAFIHSGLLTAQAIDPAIDVLGELAPIARLVQTPCVLVVRAESPYRRLSDLIDTVLARPGELSFGSGGIGTPAHVAVAEIASRVPRFDALHVPYKGAVEVNNAMLAGDVDFQAGILGSVLPLLRSGQFRALAVTSRVPVSSLPSVPTMAEAGIAGLVVEPWGGLAMPAGAPTEAVKRLNALLPSLLAAAPLSELMIRLGLVSAFADASRFALQIAAELSVERLRVRRLGFSAPP